MTEPTLAELLKTLERVRKQRDALLQTSEEMLDVINGDRPPGHRTCECRSCIAVEALELAITFSKSETT